MWNTVACLLWLTDVFLLDLPFTPLTRVSANFNNSRTAGSDIRNSSGSHFRKHSHFPHKLTAITCYALKFKVSSWNTVACLLWLTDVFLLDLPFIGASLRRGRPSFITSHEEGGKGKKINYIDVIVSHSADVHTYNYLIFTHSGTYPTLNNTM